jgi:hypothetical protein
VNSDPASVSFEHVAVIDGRAALILASVLDKCLFSGVTLRRALTDMKVSPAFQEAALQAQRELRTTGARWLEADEAQRKPDARTETNGNAGVILFDAMTVCAAAQLLNRTESRVRQLARAGVLTGSKGPRGWVLDRREVTVFHHSQSQTLGADVSYPPLAEAS